MIYLFVMNKNTSSLAETILAEMKADFDKRQASRAAFSNAKPEVEIDGRRYSVVEAFSTGPGADPYAFTVRVGDFVAYVSTHTKRFETAPEFTSSISHSRPFEKIEILESVRQACAAAREVWA